MNSTIISSITCQLQATNHAHVFATKGEAEHAAGHDLFRQCDPVYARRLHDEPGYRPFTISSMEYVHKQGNSFEMYPGDHCFLHITSFDGGYLWITLLTRFQTGEPLFVRCGSLELRLEALFSSPQDDPTGLACSNDWSTLVSLPHSPLLYTF